MGTARRSGTQRDGGHTLELAGVAKTLRLVARDGQPCRLQVLRRWGPLAKIPAVFWSDPGQARTPRGKTRSSGLPHACRLEVSDFTHAG